MLKDWDGTSVFDLGAELYCVETVGVEVYVGEDVGEEARIGKELVAGT